MKKFLKVLGAIIAVLIVVIGVFYFVSNESLPIGKQGKEADELATKMLSALNNEAYQNTELIEWNFRNKHFYKWHKQDNVVDVSWDENKVILHTKSPEKSEVFVNDKKVENPELISEATAFFNNDSFWLVAPYKVFDPGTERRIVDYNKKEALLITYTSGGTTPGDSYLWILDSTYVPKSFKMWTKVIPIGGVKATWKDWTSTESGIKLPTKHKLSLFGLGLDLGNVKATNPKADELANKILAAIKHENYKKTNFIEWSFAGKRFFKWNKKEHIVDVKWDSIHVILHPNEIEKSTIFINENEIKTDTEKLVKKATDIFNNDSFWLVAPHKLFENGIIRTIVTEDNKEALKVTYTIGGSTPGDSYIWILDSNYVPKSWKMFVRTMNMNGVPATWEDWITTESGTLLVTNHTFSNRGQLSMGEVSGHN